MYADENAFLAGNLPIQFDNFHKSCSQDHFLKDIFGFIQIFEFDNGDGMFLCFLPVTFSINVGNVVAGGNSIIITEFTGNVSSDSDLVGVMENLLLQITDPILQPDQINMVTMVSELDMNVRQLFTAVVEINAVTTGGTTCDATDSDVFEAGKLNLNDGLGKTDTPLP